MPGATSFAPQPMGPGKVPPTRLYRRSRLRLEVTSTGIQTNDVVGVLRDEIAGEAQEVVLIAAVDGHGYVADVVEVARGGYHSVNVSIPPLVAVPVLAGTGYAVMAHNHPLSGPRLMASKHDMALTKTVIEALNSVGVILSDHLIFGPDGRHLSFKDTGKLTVPAIRRLEVQA